MAPFPHRARRLRATVALAVLACAGSGCERPLVARDGTVTFQEKGAHGAAVVTANGIEYHDRMDRPERVVVRDPNEPWHAPIGFILPANGRFTQTSRPTLAATTGLAFAMRPSDTRVPAWGGEVLVRIDVLAPAAAGTSRDPERVALVLHGEGPDTAALAAAVLAQLGGRDHVTVFDARGAKLVVPTMPASHRSLAMAAIERRLESERREVEDFSGAIARAHAAVGTGGSRRVVVLSDGREPLASPAEHELEGLAREHILAAVIATRPDADLNALDGMAGTANAVLVADEALDARVEALHTAIPTPGLVVYRDVVLTFEGTPAPSHVLEASGGEVRWRLDAGELALGDVYAGQMRTGIVRVTVPAWVPGEQFKFTVTAHVDDVARGGRRDFSAELPCVYDDDIERIANSRHGDVISYASALATLKKLDAAFVGAGVARAGGLRKVALMHARSMALLARDMHDPQIFEQAELLSALLAATE